MIITERGLVLEKEECTSRGITGSEIVLKHEYIDRIVDKVNRIAYDAGREAAVMTLLNSRATQKPCYPLMTIRNDIAVACGYESITSSFKGPGDVTIYHDCETAQLLAKLVNRAVLALKMNIEHMYAASLIQRKTVNRVVIADRISEVEIVPDILKKREAQLELVSFETYIKEMTIDNVSELSNELWRIWYILLKIIDNEVTVCRFYGEHTEDEAKDLTSRVLNEVYITW